MSLKEIGARIKSARMQLGYSRKKFAEKYHFSSATLQAWEDGKYTVPLKGILKYIHALDEAGLVSSVDWFIHGVGVSPRPKVLIKQVAPIVQPLNIEENSFFEQSNQNSILVSITDDTMIPFFKPGDFVGGYFIPIDRVDEYIGSYCIVIIATGEILVRKLKYGSKAGFFTLVSTNLDSVVDTAFLTNCDIQKIAPVTWHRKAYNDPAIVQ
ncbi:MAG: helix-turn-helix domain-containing protein [Legionella sp.]|nr:helix-turn-helix domain-containing protein [Legionella sp.]